MSHTPGKLTVQEREPGDKVIVIEGEAKDYFVNLRCEVDCDDNDHDTAQANAKRLAHCWNCHDDLVAALQGLIADIASGSTVTLASAQGKAAVEAWQKAKGE